MDLRIKLFVILMVISYGVTASSIIFLNQCNNISRLGFPLFPLFGFLIFDCRAMRSLGVKSRPLSTSSCHDHMPMILDRVVSTTWEKPCDDGPSVPMNSVRSKEPFFFLWGEGAAIDPWVQLIEPSQPTTLSWFKFYLTCY